MIYRSLETPTAHRPVASELESLHIESESSLVSLETLGSLAGSDRLLDELKLRELTISQLRGRVLQLERARLDKIPLDPAREISRLQSSVVSAGEDDGSVKYGREMQMYVVVGGR